MSTVCVSLTIVWAGLKDETSGAAVSFLHYWQQLLVILLVEECDVELCTCKRQVFLMETGAELVDWLIHTCIVEFAAATDVEKENHYYQPHYCMLITWWWFCQLWLTNHATPIALTVIRAESRNIMPRTIPTIAPAWERKQNLRITHAISLSLSLSLSIVLLTDSMSGSG